MDCILCKIKEQTVPYSGVIAKTKYWTIMVSREQHTLGTLIVFHNTHTVRFSSISKQALLEFQHIQVTFEKALSSLFNPDLFNYLQCGNQVEHLHFHLIPRYKSSRNYHNQEFVDINYGNSVKETHKITSDAFITLLKHSIQCEIHPF
ncbi:HIT family protein [Ascidiimonas aurantiaca]|uniref:HIT family protein n=1 Tax=Ascidiimonas aurantiaca TaxID=1685432 RepID=UPI0030EC3C04